MPPRGGGSGGGRGKRPPQTREVTISKNLGYLLRHGAVEEGVSVDEGGWASVRDVLLWRRLASLKVTLAELYATVTSNDKQRFQIIPNPALPPSPTPTPLSPTTSSDPSLFLIRAVQGHSLPAVSAEKLLTPVSATDPDCPTLVVHGTYPKMWSEIRKSGGLKPMGRNHVHFARGEPDASSPSSAGSAKDGKVEELPTEAAMGTDRVVSGMRKGASVLVWVDVRGSLQGGVKWWRSENGVFLTDGAEREGERVLGFEWIRWVERREGREVLWRGEEVDVEGERMAVGTGGLGVRGGGEEGGKVVGDGEGDEVEK